MRIFRFLRLVRIEDDAIPAMTAHQTMIDAQQHLFPWAQFLTAVRTGIKDSLIVFSLLSHVEA